MRLSKIQKKLINICEIFKLGEIEAYQQEDSSQNRVFKIITTKGSYIVKEFSKDTIGNYYYLRKRKEQIAISEQLKKHKINCIIPKRINDKQFFLLDKQYYLVYDCSKDKYLTQDNITKNHIIELAKTQAKIHKLKIETKLPCTYKHINIDFDLYTKTIKDPNLKDLIYSNKEKLIEYIKKGNNALPSVKKNLCYSHNDYKHQIDKNLNVTDKMRYAFINNGDFFKLDVFNFDTSKGILSTESSADENDVKIPEFIKVIKDVTGDVDYKNYYLAKYQRYKND